MYFSVGFFKIFQSCFASFNKSKKKFYENLIKKQIFKKTLLKIFFVHLNCLGTYFSDSLEILT